MSQVFRRARYAAGTVTSVGTTPGVIPFWKRVEAGFRAIRRLTWGPANRVHFLIGGTFRRVA